VRTLFAILVILSTLGAPASPAAAEETFFLRIGAGASIPFLKSLDSELELQGNKTVSPGYGLGVSLGRAFAERQWSIEVHFATMFYPGFDYTNPLDSFPGKLRHYSYMAVARRHFRPEGTLFKPSIGVGIGYGLTNLVSGGGKLAAAEALLTGRIDSSIRGTIELAIECSYYTGLQSKEFGQAFLENVETDIVVDSSGNALKDTYRSLEIRIGITVWLRQMGPR
jgi:hypothetical protein